MNTILALGTIGTLVSYGATALAAAVATFLFFRANPNKRKNLEGKVGRL
jgi:hypothetical protein